MLQNLGIVSDAPITLPSRTENVSFLHRRAIDPEGNVFHLVDDREVGRSLINAESEVIDLCRAEDPKSIVVTCWHLGLAHCIAWATFPDGDIKKLSPDDADEFSFYFQ